ncbi:MAG: trigger factor [Planctomycetaceae bacterium]|jgi:trigger factor|nr:trigger factor [Planctomycetaceae bacterium]
MSFQESFGALDQELNQQEEETTLVYATEIKVVSACERVIEITIPRGEVDRYFDEQFNELKQSAQIPGFRPGKAPRSLIEKKFKRDVDEQVKRSLVTDALRAVSTSKLDIVPISEPTFDIDAYKIPETGPFVFEFSVEVRPDFELPEWKGLQIDKPVREVKSEDVDREIVTILAEHGTLIPIETPAEKGNYIEANIKSELDGVILNVRENEQICIKKSLVFQDGVIENFDELTSGAKEGDIIKTKITVSEFAKNIEAQGKTVDVTLEVLGVKRIELPELTPEMLQRLGNFADAADLRDFVLDKLKAQVTFEQNLRIRNQITTLLYVSADWELPPEMLERQAEREIKRKEYELTSSGYSAEYVASQSNLLRQNINESTAKALKEHFILEKIAEAENIVDKEEDREREIELLARSYGISPRKLKANIEKNNQMDLLRNQIIERKVIQQIAKHAVFIEVPFEFEVLDIEAVKWSVTGGDNKINEATAEDLKAVHKEAEYRKRVDPNTKNG